MSSQSQGRYQSRLFNFVHRQSRRLTEQFGQTLRQVQVVTKWGVGLIAFPIYKILHSVENSGKQLQGQTAQEKQRLKAIPQATHKSADEPTQQVIQAIEHASSKGIRGVASQLSNRSLVLVTAENEIQDILTSEQQEFLQEKIITETDSYQRELSEAKVKNKTQISAKIDRILNKLVGENPEETSNLVPANPEETELKPLPVKSGVLTVLDNVIAGLESNGLTPVLKRGVELVKKTRTQLNIFVYGEDSEVIDKGQIVPTNDLETSRNQIRNIIWSAFNYFFSDAGNQLESNTRVKGKRLPPRQKLSPSPEVKENDEAENNWLSMKDLFGEGEVKDKSLPPATRKYSPQEMLRSYNQFIQPQSGGELVKPQKVTSEISRSQTISGELARKQEKKSGLAKKTERPQSSQMEAKPDWIETDSEPVGYDKHLVEIGLEWFDGLMVWLEELAVKIFRLLQQFVRGK
ncbi:MAG: hypothetical protein KME64_11355 [Scytonematopsis contorta HA4267-MV1]|jgi:hypothetical protein|nr:hypothetical protein [Scytonematopsis contorta HA4267-MV1]